jgi:MFS family permease
MKDGSAFPLIMPDITDTFDSLHLIGWYGSIYFLAISATFPLFVKLYPTTCGMQKGRGLPVVLLTSSLTFGSGLMCCCFASNNVSMLVGRALCGIGAAGITSGITFIMEEALVTRTAKRQMTMIDILLLTLALSRFVGPL